jgi:hemoglobin
MKIQSLSKKTFWLGLIFTAVIVGAIFRLSPSLAVSTPITVPKVQQSAPATTLIAADTSGGSLYQRLGGYNGIASVIDYTAQYAFNDPVIGKYFIGLSTNSKHRLRELLVEQFCQATGGPCIYLGRTMQLSHGGIGLSDDEFNAFANDVSKALDQVGVNRSDKNAVLKFVESQRSLIVENNTNG